MGVEEVDDKKEEDVQEDGRVGSGEIRVGQRGGRSFLMDINKSMLISDDRLVFITEEKRNSAASRGNCV